MSQTKSPRAVRAGQESVTSANMSDAARWSALADIAFGESWQSLHEEIDGRLKPFANHEPIVQSTRRALELIRTMTFDPLAR